MPPETKVASGTAVPPCSSNVTANGIWVHCACTTRFSAGGEKDALNFVPSVSSVNQPSKVYPARVGSAGRVTVPPETKVVLGTVVPPYSSYVTVNTVFAEIWVHCACTTRLPSGGVEVEPYFVPPVCAVNQPSNV